MKTCATCHVPKPLREFYKRGDKKGCRPNCKACYKKKGRLRNNSDKEKKRVSAAKEMEAIGRNPHAFLAAAIIELAIREYRNWRDGEAKSVTDYKPALYMAEQLGYANPVEEIEAFFESEWFEELAGYAGCDPGYLRKHILESE